MSQLNQRERLFFVLGAVAAAQLSIHLAYAEGFRNPPAGAFSLARAGGRIAHVNDASAITHNPANLVEIPGPSVELSGTMVHIQAEFQSALGGQRAETRDPFKYLPNFWATVPIFTNKLAAGLGVTTPYGLSNEWRQDGAYAPGGVLRYAAPWYTELVTFNFNPTISYKPIEQLSLGAGLNIQYSEITFKQFYPWFLFNQTPGPAPDGNIEATGDGVGFGGNLGVTWHLTEKQRLSATYRSPIDIEYEGKFRIDNVHPNAAALGATSESNFGTEIEFPMIIGLGYGLQLTDTIRLEVDGEWLQFSRFERLDLQTGNNQFLVPSTLEQQWEDTFTIGIAGDWQFANDWALRAGYQFYETPVPDRTLSPTIPDANQHAFTGGLGYRKGHHRGELAYGYIRYDDRNISANLNPAFNGQYEVQVHLVSISYAYTF